MTESSSTLETSEPVSTGAPTPEAAESSSTSQTTARDEGGDSSPANRQQAETRETLLDVVKRVAPKHDAEQRSDGSGASPASAAQEKEEDLGPLTQAEMDGYRFRTQKRMKQLMAESESLKARLAPLEAQAKTTSDLQNFLKSNDIAKEDFGLMLDLAAALRRSDFKTFLEGVTPYVQVAREALGIDLPADLRQAVQAGHMTQDAARYVAQQRTALAVATQTANRATHDVTVQNFERERQALQSSVQSAVTDWENQTKRSDPDYARKEPIVRDLLHAVVTERGPPRSPQEAVEIARQAYERANAVIAHLNPQPRSTRQVPSSLQKVNGARPEPKTLKEAVHQALERARA